MKNKSGIRATWSIRLNFLYDFFRWIWKKVLSESKSISNKARHYRYFPTEKILKDPRLFLFFKNVFIELYKKTVNCASEIFAVYFTRCSLQRHISEICVLTVRFDKRVLKCNWNGLIKLKFNLGHVYSLFEIEYKGNH